MKSTSQIGVRLVDTLLKMLATMYTVTYMKHMQFSLVRHMKDMAMKQSSSCKDATLATIVYDLL
jgi:hypothetical protein